VARSAAAAAEQADQLKTAFLAKVSHELRTPIQSVLGYGELLRGAITDPTALGRLAALRQHGELMLRLVNDLLDLSAIQAGAFRLVEKSVALGDLVKQTAESLRPRAEAKNLAFVVTIDPAVPLWARIDPERIRQVIINLAANAIKFTDAGRVEIDLRPGPGEDDVTLRVRDTGPGILRGEQARIFRPFERLDKTAAKEGAGLGLALAAALCRGMGGDIAVESEAGKGATFQAWFRAPSCAAPSVMPEVSTPSARLAGRRILVADDNALVRELFTACLQDAGAYCVAVNDGEAALAAAEAGAFDAVVLDVAMPRLDGVEVARRLRATHGSSLRIIGVSAHAGEREQGEARRAGMNQFLVKPIGLDALLATLAPAEAKRPFEDGTSVLLEKMRARFRGLAAAEGAALAASIAAGDFLQARSRAHHLMNSAAVVRDDRLFMACAAAERAATEADCAALTAAGAAFEAALAPWTAGVDPKAAS
jgi:CheY-like chemotaxis protein/two-component sensor histidine kinase